MKLKKNLVIIGAVSLLAASCNTKTTQTPPPPAPISQPVDADGGNETAETAMKERQARTKALTQKGPESKTAAQPAQTPISKTGEYKDYSPATVTEAQKVGNKVVLFFHADWCPFCVEADKQFKARQEEIPSGVTVLKTHYDTETVLKQKYGVTYQHTFVQIDAQGNMVTKWNGGDVENLKKYLK